MKIAYQVSCHLSSRVQGMEVNCSLFDEEKCIVSSTWFDCHHSTCYRSGGRKELFDIYLLKN